VLNKITIELSVPVLGGNADETASILKQQTDTLVAYWRGILGQFKDSGVVVPTLSVKAGKSKKVFDTSAAKALLSHHLQYFPKADVKEQMSAIKTLLETGKSVDELIEFYNNSKRGYNLTSWFTVKYKMARQIETEEEGFERKALSADDKAALIARLRGE
jgi:hypothetical protein